MIFPNKITDIIGGFDFQVSNWTELLNAETSFVNRFKFVPRLHNPLLDSEDKADDLCWELLIPTNIIGELKEKLDSMGIDEAFLFPDNLEYTVEKIEKMYLKKLQV